MLGNTCCVIFAIEIAALLVGIPSKKKQNQRGFPKNNGLPHVCSLRTLNSRPWGTQVSVHQRLQQLHYGIDCGHLEIDLRRPVILQANLLLHVKSLRTNWILSEALWAFSGQVPK